MFDWALAFFFFFAGHVVHQESPCTEPTSPFYSCPFQKDPTYWLVQLIPSTFSSELVRIAQLLPDWCRYPCSTGLHIHIIRWIITGWTQAWPSCLRSPPMYVHLDGNIRPKTESLHLEFHQENLSVTWFYFFDIQVLFRWPLEIRFRMRWKLRGVVCYSAGLCSHVCIKWHRSHSLFA